MAQLAVVGETTRTAVDGSPETASYRAAIRAFGDVAEALSDVTDLDTLLHLIAQRICELAGVRRCSVYLRDSETGLFHGQVGHSDHDIDASVKRLVAGLDADRFTREIVETKQPVLVSNALSDPRPIRAAMRAWKIRSMLGVPMVQRGEVIGIVFLDNEEEPHTFEPSAHEIASTFADLAAVAISQTQMTAELRASLGTVARQNDLLRRAAAIDERLNALVLEGTSLREIAGAVAELTGKPTSIHDADYRRLAAATPRWLEQDVTPRLLEEPYRSEPAVIAALGALEEKRGGVVGPLPAIGLPHRFLLVPVTMRDQGWGHLVMMEYRGRFASLDLHVARRAATNIALELAAEQRAVEAEWDARASLAADLIRGNRDALSLQRRAEYLGVDLAAPRVLCLITADGTGTGALPSCSELSLAMVGTGDDRSVLAAGVAEGVVALVELDAGVSTLEAVSRVRLRVADALEQLDRDAGLAGAVSTRCQDLHDYVRAYGETQQVMSCLQTLSGPNGARVLSADELGPGRLFLASSDRPSAERFAQDALGALLVSAETLELLKTLYVFFECARSVRRAAPALGVHENTIRYRLTRIEEMTGLCVGGDSTDQLTAQLALLVLRLEGRLPDVSELAPTSACD